MSYIMGLDGLRALSVLVVLCYHAHLPWARGGYLGVEVFFVISGFLITRLLVLEHGETGRISLGRFWFRRFKRLLPALWAILAGLTLLGATLPWLKAAQFRGDLAASFLYVENWYQIHSGGSYFSDQGLPLLRHIWSLAVEEQFYALWPPLVVAALWIGRGRRRILALVTFLLAAASAWAFFHLADPDNASSVQALESMNRAYLGTDARACGILLGALLGMVRPPSAPPRPWAKGLIQAWAFLALAGILALCGLLDIQNRLLYRGGLLLVDGLTLSLLAVLVLAGPTLLRSILEWRVLTWIGKRSYGIYLWHWPVFRLLGPGQTGWTWIAARWGLSFLLAALSFALVETPIREGRLGRWLAQPGTWRRTARRLAFGATLAGGVAATTWAGVKVHQLPPYVDEIQESLKANARALDAGPHAK
ncbi:MAG TPA: acyltransferase, partial [Holophaga sp.]|nr:acyltransferase [Holophaga sp.]